MPEIYTCSVCGAIAGYATGRYRRKGILTQPGTWWCRAHRPKPEITPQPAMAGGKDARAPSAPSGLGPRQGRLAL